ncbi:MAG TPA: hypothetical protein VFR32_09330 [Gaiellaceae bacterium]|nr:hypothetical protein [Gaiellaceae bacterium]
MRAATAVSTMAAVQPEPLIYREEVLAILGVLADINVNVGKVVRLLEDEYGEEEEDSEDDV